MSVTIRASSFFMKRYLTVKDQGVVFMETAALGGKRRFQFGQIDYVLMSPTNVLSFQVGQEIFSIPVKPWKPKHQLAMQKLKDGVSSSYMSAKGFPVTMRSVR